MSGPVSLEALISAVAGAVIEAQDRVDGHQLTILRHYFNDAGEPLALDLKVPSLRRDATPYDELAVPLIAVAPTSFLKITECTVDFEVELGDLSTTSADTAARQTGAVAAAMASGPGTGAPIDVVAVAPRSAAGAAPGAAAVAAPPSPSAGLTVGLQSSAPQARGPMARLTLKVEGQPPSEGMARLVQELNKRF